MKGTHQRREGTALIGSLLGTLLFLIPLAAVSPRDATLEPDPCEVEAMKAYRQALDLCSLSEGNPRLRCYETAKAVYVKTLQDCRKSH